jgi:hypothetical protein
MSIFNSAAAPCPHCGTENNVEVVASLNADRRPDLRDGVLDGTFQTFTCTTCGEEFRLQPRFTYIDAGRRQWILAHPVDEMVRWQVLEEQGRGIFDEGYGAGAPRLIRSLGAEMTPRITFGWPALREKLAARAAGIDDADLELLKMAIIRDVAAPPMADQSELRLDRVDDDTLVFAWLVSDTEGVLNSLRVPRATLDELAADPAPQSAVRAQLSGGLFTDLNRFLVTA